MGEPAPVCLDNELECVEEKEPVQIEAEKSESYRDVLLEEPEENLSLGEDLAPEIAPVIDEPMPQVCPKIFYAISGVIPHLADVAFSFPADSRHGVIKRRRNGN